MTIKPALANSTAIIGVGALGGSGTRAVAAVLQEAGLFIGDDLNHALDNKIFSRLFRNPGWFKKASPREIEKHWDWFTQIMQGEKLGLRQARALRKAMLANPSYASGPQHVEKHRGYFLLTPPRAQRSHWGWKEPNTQFYATHFLKMQPNFKYVHVLRHGLDMAFSKNKNQLSNWDFLFQLKGTSNASLDHAVQQQLQFWIDSTQYILMLKRQYPNRLFILTRDQLIYQPEQAIPQLLEFAALEVSEKLLAQLTAIPQPQPGDGRFKRQDLTVFSAAQIERVNHLLKEARQLER